MNKGFAIIAPVLLVLALGLLMMPKGQNSRELNPTQLLAEVNDQTRFLTTDQVAANIIRKDPSMQLVDVRKPADFEVFSLQGAINIPLDSLLNPQYAAIIDDQNKQTVFYSNADILSEQAFLLCRRAGMKNVMVLKGGLNSWFNTIIKPVAPSQSASRAEFELYSSRLAARQFFTGASTVAPSAAAQKSKEPVKVNLKPVAKKEAEGGC